MFVFYFKHTKIENERSGQYFDRCFVLAYLDVFYQDFLVFHRLLLLVFHSVIVRSNNCTLCKGVRVFSFV